MYGQMSRLLYVLLNTTLIIELIDPADRHSVSVSRLGKFFALAISGISAVFISYPLTTAVLSDCFCLSYDPWLRQWTDSRSPDDPWLCFWDWILHTLRPLLLKMDPRPSTSRDDIGNAAAPQDSKRRLYTAEVKARWSLPRLVRELGTRDQCIRFAEEQGLVKKESLCRSHRRPMVVDLSVNNTVGAFRCTKSICAQKSRISRAHGTWFEDVKLKMAHIFYLMYGFAHLWTYDKIIHEDPVQGEHCLSRTTISDWFSYCREAIVIYQLNKEQEKGKIGGPGKIVQIDKSKFGKRKYNKGQRVEGHWVLGMIEDGSTDLRLEVCPDNICSGEVLVPLIKKHVAEGTTIHTDSWRAYDCLGEHNYIHKKINHNDPENPYVTEDCTHTQRIESQWRVVKDFFNRDYYKHPENFGDIIVECMWRRDLQKFKKDPFIELIQAVKVIYDPNKR